jgi:membrane associated rhomboid family serine protease
MSQPPAPETEVPTCYRHPGREAHIRCQRCNRIICPDCMRPAAVGFQCPNCVAEGAKTTRSGRTPYGGLRPTDASVTSMVLIALNAAVWIAIVVTGWTSSELIGWLSLHPEAYCHIGDFNYDYGRAACDVRGGTFIPGVSDGAYWQLVTSMFTHVQLWHIGFNMFALWVLGPALEQALGRWRFLALYFLSGLAGSALVYWGDRGALGASGAIFGLMAALLILAIKSRGDVRGILTWIGINFVITVVFGRSISWEGHLGGFIGGLAIGAVLIYAPRGPRRTAVQVAGLVSVALLIAAAIIARTANLS